MQSPEANVFSFNPYAKGQRVRIKVAGRHALEYSSEQFGIVTQTQVCRKKHYLSLEWKDGFPKLNFKQAMVVKLTVDVYANPKDRETGTNQLRTTTVEVFPDGTGVYPKITRLEVDEFQGSND